MKVIFLFGGLPHYFNKVLNKINADEAIEVAVIAPLGSGKTMGSGVNQTDEGISFKLIRLEEYNTWYGKPFFRNFYQTIKAEKPDAIVCGWPYFLVFLFNPILLLRLKIQGVQLISKEIPFTVPAWNESFRHFDKRCVASQKNELIFKNKAAFFLLKLVRKYLYSVVFNKALLYLEQGMGIIHSYGLKRKMITITYNSPDTDEIADIIQTAGEVKKQRYRLIHVGRLVQWKNVHLLIEAVHILKDKYFEIELAIIGKGEEEENLKAQVDRLNLKAHVQFLGAIYEGRELSIEMLRSEVYILAGMGGLSINEAMAHGLPVICSVADGTEKHLVFEGENGYYFEDNNLDSLVKVIEKMFQSDTEAMGQKSKEIIRDSINIDKVSGNYIRALKSK